MPATIDCLVDISQQNIPLSVIIVGIGKMSKVLDVNFADRTMRVQAGLTNLGISNAVAHEGFFYAPDPSSQLACTIAGNIAMNSGGAHCLRYGVTTNNILGVRMVMIDGIVRCGRSRNTPPATLSSGMVASLTNRMKKTRSHLPASVFIAPACLLV